MLSSIKDTLNITRNASNIKSNHAVTDTLLNKVSFLEVEIQNNKEDAVENMKVIKHLTEFNRKTNEVSTNTLNERLEELEVENIELKSMLLRTSKHILKNDEIQRKINNKKDKQIHNLNTLVIQLRIDSKALQQKFNAVLEYIEESKQSTE